MQYAAILGLMTAMSWTIAAVGSVIRATPEATACGNALPVALPNGAHNCEVLANGESAVFSGNYSPTSGGAMGYSKSREKGANHERRTLQRAICFAPHEMQLVIQRARAAGLPVARYIRESTLASARARRTHLNNAMINALGQIALRLTLLATQAKNQHLAEADAFDEAVSKALDIIRELE
jgi:hypothetical protein